MGNENQLETNGQTTENEQTTAPTGETPKGEETNPNESDVIKENAELKIELRKQKKMIDQYSSQISGLKKQLNEKLAQEGEKATQQTEEMAEIKEQLKKALDNIAFRDTVDGYVSLGMDKEYATKVAQLKMDGDEDLVNSSLKSFLESEKKKVREETTQELYAKMPAPVSGNGDGQIDYKKQYEEKLASGDIAGAISAQLLASAKITN